MYRNPVYRGSMTPQQRYRLRMKLQASLLSVVRVIEEMTAAEVEGSRKNLMTADAVMRRVERFFHPSEEPLLVQPEGLEALKYTAKRRFIETAKRRRRKARRRR